MSWLNNRFSEWVIIWQVLRFSSKVGVMCLLGHWDWRLTIALVVSAAAGTWRWWICQRQPIWQWCRRSGELVPSYYLPLLSSSSWWSPFSAMPWSWLGSQWISSITLGKLVYGQLYNTHLSNRTLLFINCFRGYIFLFNLAVIDFLISISVMPISLVTLLNGEFIFSHAVCEFNGFTIELFFIANIHTLMYMAVYR